MRHNFDPYNGDDIIDSSDIRIYLDDLIDEVSNELQDIFNISEEDALLFLEYDKLDDGTGKEPPVTRKQYKMIDKIYLAISNVGEPRRKQWNDGGRLEKIKELSELVDGIPEDETLIREEYFVEYAKELAEDIGAISKESQWPNACIDWEKASDELKCDFTSCEIDGTTYYYRE